jgi:hypothetical protein
MAPATIPGQQRDRGRDCTAHGGARSDGRGEATRLQPLLRDLMVPPDNGRQSVLLLKGWVRKPETRCATPPIGKHSRLDSEGLRYPSFIRGRRRLYAAIKNRIWRDRVGVRTPRHDTKTLRRRLSDRQAGAAFDVELHVGACLTSTPHLQPADDAQDEQSAACVEDRIAPTLDQGIAGIHHPIPLAVLGQADGLKLNPCRQAHFRFP